MRDETRDPLLVSVGQEMLGIQDRLIFEWLERLESVRDWSVEESPRQALENLLGYLEDHFDTEERLMKRLAFPWLKHHARAHRALGADYRHLVMASAPANELPDPLAVRAFRERLETHMKTQDAALQTYMEGAWTSGA